MGFFDEFNSFVGEISSLKSEMTNFKNGFIEELHTEADSVSQTIDGTVTDIKQTAVQIGDTVKQSTSLTQPDPQIIDDTKPE